MNKNKCRHGCLAHGDHSFIHLLLLWVLEVKENKAALAGVAQWIGVLVCEPKGCRFDYQSGHMPGLWARSPIGGV